MKIKIMSLLIFALAGCSSDNTNSPADIAEEVDAPQENIIVYISKGSTQCNNDGLSEEASTQSLVDVGIDVLETYCGRTTELDFPTVCGAGTGEIIAHEIREVNLESAIEEGYQDIESLIDEENMLSYEINECTNSQIEIERKKTLTPKQISGWHSSLYSHHPCFSFY